MKLFQRFIYIFFILIFFTGKSNSIEKIAYVDMDFVIQNSSIGKKMLDKINNLNKKNLTELTKKDEILKKLEVSIKSQKKIISEEAFKKEVISFRKKAQEYAKEKDLVVKEFNNFKRSELEEIFKIISPIISDYMEKNSVNILFDSKNVFMGSKDSNITEEIIIEINKIIK